jgi:hypothetical protein
VNFCGSSNTKGCVDKQVRTYHRHVSDRPTPVSDATEIAALKRPFTKYDNLTRFFTRPVAAHGAPESGRQVFSKSVNHELELRAKDMRTIAVFSVIVLCLLVRTASAQQPSNALWNNSGPQGLIGVWIYRVAGRCPELRTSAKPLVFATHAKDGTYDVAQLLYCFQLPESSKDKPVRCKSGTVHLELDRTSQRYSGDYSFETTDGSKRNDHFIAGFCPKDAI